jgi:hypothetical protein
MDEIYVWVARCKDEMSDDRNLYKLYASKPQMFPDGVWLEKKEESLLVPCLCPKMFEPMTGIKLKPGECKRFLWRSPLLPVPKKKAAKKG